LSVRTAVYALGTSVVEARRHRPAGRYLSERPARRRSASALPNSYQRQVKADNLVEPGRVSAGTTPGAYATGLAAATPGAYATGLAAATAGAYATGLAAATAGAYATGLAFCSNRLRRTRLTPPRKRTLPFTSTTGTS